MSIWRIVRRFGTRARNDFHRNGGFPRGFTPKAWRIEAFTACQMFVVLDGTGVIGGLGVIANNFHRRTDLTPKICAVYVEPRARGRGVARALIDRVCAELSAAG